jgi:streptolysin S family bacteriocin protoxin
MIASFASLLVLLLPGTAAVPDDVPPQIVLHRLECGLRGLAFNWSQELLPSGGAAQDSAVASALRLASDCHIDARLREEKAVVAPPAVGASAAACVLHVATTSGSDSTGSGSAAAPFATLHRAQKALAAARKSTAEPCTVNVHPGVYHLGSTLVLGPADSNTEWLAVPGGPVVLSGGIPIPWSSFKPSAANPKIMEADVSNLTTITPRGASGGPANRLFVDHLSAPSRGG